MCISWDITSAWTPNGLKGSCGQHWACAMEKSTQIHQHSPIQQFIRVIFLKTCRYIKTHLLRALNASWTIACDEVASNWCLRKSNLNVCYERLYRTTSIRQYMLWAVSERLSAFVMFNFILILLQHFKFFWDFLASRTVPTTWMNFIAIRNRNRF